MNQEQQIEKMAEALAREAVTRRLVKQGFGLGDIQKMLPDTVQNMLPTDPAASQAILGGLIGAGGLGATGMLVNSLTAKKKRPLRSLLTGALLGGVGGAALGGLTAPTPKPPERQLPAPSHPIGRLISSTVGAIDDAAPGTFRGTLAGTAMGVGLGRFSAGLPGRAYSLENRGRQLANLLVDLQGRGQVPGGLTLPHGADPAAFARSLQFATQHRGSTTAQQLAAMLTDHNATPIQLPVALPDGTIHQVSIGPGQVRAIRDAGLPQSRGSAIGRFLTGQWGSESWTPRGAGNPFHTPPIPGAPRPRIPIPFTNTGIPIPSSNPIGRAVGARFVLPLAGASLGFWRDMSPRPPAPTTP